MATLTNPLRSAGILLHPTSLPGPYGIGDLGPVAANWVDALSQAQLTWWQMLPLGPTGAGDSPYQSPSSFAGNPLLLSPELLARDGLLSASDISPTGFSRTQIDYAGVYRYKNYLINRAWEAFKSGRGLGLRGGYDAFCHREASWLDDYALFCALKERHGERPWYEWPTELVQREPVALKKAAQDAHDAVDRHRFTQFLFYRQWDALRAYARSRGISLIGDVPIFVSLDSADVWANPELFRLDANKRPTVVTGVPPDYFSHLGQLWGNPHYDWQSMERDGFAWWIARLKATLRQVDLVRLDHFRGFAAAWEVPAGAKTAQVGQWVPGPGRKLLDALRRGLGGLPLIAEDLGVITPDVIALRDAYHLPGMRVLQFAFDRPDNPFLPHHYTANSVVYTGTHDNDTTIGWFWSLDEGGRATVRRFFPWVGKDIAWEMMRIAWSSVADYAIVPLQDVLTLGTEARMNYPGVPEGNWRWRFTEGQLTRGHLDGLAELTVTYSRDPLKAQTIRHQEAS
ncbi:MAG: 4-alpha-glucanotransferase [Gemmataceae bacterium]